MLHFIQVPFQNVLVEFQYGFGEHPYRQVNQIEFAYGEVSNKATKKVVSKIDIVNTVITVPGHIFRRKINSSFAQRIDYLCSFCSELIM